MFIRPNKDMVLKTTKGDLKLLKSEYFILDDKNGRKPLVINKEGVQKIEDYFDVHTEIIGEGGVLNNIYVKVRMSTPEGLKVERIGSANDRNLTTAIAQSYPFEMAFKRACATAALEILRKNYRGEEGLPLLYSSFDEFKTEDSVNQAIPVVEEASETPEESEVSETPKTSGSTVSTVESDMVDVTNEENNPFTNNEQVDESTQPADSVEANASTDSAEPAESTENTITSSLGAYIIKSNKYRNGITLQELAEKDINYLNWLVKGDNMRGRYQEYQETARKFVEEAGIELPA
jgi:hypothetical protein